MKQVNKVRLHNCTGDNIPGHIYKWIDDDLAVILLDKGFYSDDGKMFLSMIVAHKDNFDLVELETV